MFFICRNHASVKFKRNGESIFSDNPFKALIAFTYTQIYRYHSGRNPGALNAGNTFCVIAPLNILTDIDMSGPMAQLFVVHQRVYTFFGPKTKIREPISAPFSPSIYRAPCMSFPEGALPRHLAPTHGRDLGENLQVFYFFLYICLNSMD